MRIRTYKKTILSDTKIENILKIIRRIYIFLIIWSGLYFISVVIALIIGEAVDKTQRAHNWEMLITFMVYVIIYIGLKNKMKWVVPLVLIVSSFSLFWAIIGIVIPSENIEMVVQKFISICLLLFFIYQLSFFSKREVKSFFNEQGVVFF